MRVAIQGSGHKAAKLSLDKILIALDQGESCSTATDPREVAATEIHDIVFTESRIL